MGWTWWGVGVLEEVSSGHKGGGREWDGRDDKNGGHAML